MTGVQARCPHCDTLRAIQCTYERQGSKGSSMWWVVEHHKAPDRQELCLGSGSRV